jgi:acetolactate synthase-1/2/3 large subunit
MAIGAAIASGKRVICVTGDGGFHMNVQELEVVKRLGLVIKYFVFCNEGYGSIASMQDNHLGHRIASDKNSGLTFPPLYRIATTYGFSYREINSNFSINTLDTILNSECTEIVRVNSSLKFHYATKIESTLVNGKFVTDSMEDISPKISNLSEIMNEVIND